MNLKKIKKTSATALLLANAILTNAQITLTGNVKTSNQQRVPFTVIGIKNSYLTTQTNAQGYFEINNLKSGNYVLLTKAVGFKLKTDSLTITENNVFDIVLKETDIDLDEVVVSAYLADENSAFAHNNVTATDITKQNQGQDLPYVLNSLTSVVINSDAGNGVGYTGMRIRGTDATRINVTINGVPVNDAESQGTYFVDMPDLLSSTNNIQVQRGVGTSANGAGAFGASVNLQTNQLNDKPYAQINNNFGSYNTIKNTIAAGTGLLNNHFTLDARASRILSDGYIERASSKLSSYYIAGGYYGKKTSIKAIAFSGSEVTYQAWYYVPKDSVNKGNRTYNPSGEYYVMEDSVLKTKYYKNEVDNYKQNNYQLHLVHQFSNKLTANITGHYTAGKGYYEQYKQGQTLTNYALPNVIVDSITTITTTDLIRRKWLDNDFIGAIGNFNYTPSSKLNIVLGGGYNTYIGRHNGDVVWAQFASVNNLNPRYYSNKATKKDGNVYLKTTYKPIDKLTTFVDLQMRQVNYNFSGFDKSDTAQKQVYTKFNFFNPKFGLNYLLTKNTNVYASYGIANKEPNRNDFNSKVRPKAERLLDFEIGATHRFKFMSLAVNIYDMQYQNQLVLNGQINDVGEYLRTNVDFSYRRGIEFELNANITNYFTVNGNVTLSKNKINNFIEPTDSNDVNYTTYALYLAKYKNTDIAFSPNVIAAANFIFKPIKNLEISFLNKYVSKQYLSNTSDDKRTIHDYLVTDFRVNYTVHTKLIKDISFLATIYNLSNTIYETNGWHYAYYEGADFKRIGGFATAAPTNVMVGLNLKF